MISGFRATDYCGALMLAARRERHDHAHLPCGVALRPTDVRHGRKNGRSRCQTQKLTPWKAHDSPFYTIMFARMIARSRAGRCACCRAELSDFTIAAVASQQQVRCGMAAEKAILG